GFVVEVVAALTLDSSRVSRVAVPAPAAANATAASADTSHRARRRRRGSGSGGVGETSLAGGSSDATTSGVNWTTSGRIEIEGSAGGGAAGRLEGCGFADPTRENRTSRVPVARLRVAATLRRRSFSDRRRNGLDFCVAPVRSSGWTLTRATPRGGSTEATTR